MISKKLLFNECIFLMLCLSVTTVARGWATRLVRERAVTRLLERHDSFVKDTWLIRQEIWLIRKRDMTRSRKRHDSFVNETLLVRQEAWPIRGNTGTRLVRDRGMSHSWETHDSFVKRYDSFERETILVRHASSRTNFSTTFHTLNPWISFRRLLDLQI